MTEHEESTPVERVERSDEAYEPPRLERHGKVADLTRTRQGTGGDMSQGKGGTGDPGGD